MDLTVDIEDYKLNVRAAGLLIHNNKVLVHHNLRYGHYALVGGRVQIGENSEDTIKREIKEELGKDIEIIEYLSTIENFFETKDSKYHEIMFLYRIEFFNENDKKIEYTLESMEGKDISYEWLEINKIDEYLLYPKVLKDMLKTNDFPIHKIHSDKV